MQVAVYFVILVRQPYIELLTDWGFAIGGFFRSRSEVRGHAKPLYHKGEIFTGIAGILALIFAILCGEMKSSLKLSDKETGWFFFF